MIDVKKINESGSARSRARLYQSLALQEGINKGRLSNVGPSGKCDLGQDRRGILGRFNGTFYKNSGLYDHDSIGMAFRVRGLMKELKH